MSSERRYSVDLADAALVVCLFLLIVLFAGEPDLLDAIINRIMRG